MKSVVFFTFAKSIPELIAGQVERANDKEFFFCRNFAVT